MKKILLLFAIFVLLAVSAFFLGSKPAQSPDRPTNEEVVWEMEDKTDFIRNINIAPGEFIKSPLVITGEARGLWYFEASFPITLVNWEGLPIAQGIATAQGEWMTTDFVPFEATIQFAKPDFGERGTLILQKDNPSGLPENDDALEIPIRFK